MCMNFTVVMIFCVKYNYNVYICYNSFVEISNNCQYLLHNNILDLNSIIIWTSSLVCSFTFMIVSIMRFC